jgi:hypothetical protein
VDNPAQTSRHSERGFLVTSGRQAEELAYAVVKAVFENFA